MARPTAVISRGRVLVLVPEFPVASETFVVDHVVGLCKAGWDVQVACFQHHPAAAARHGGAVEGLPIHVLHEAPADLLARARAWLTAARHTRSFADPVSRSCARRSGPLDRLVAHLRPSLVHAHFGPAGLVASFTARRFDLPLVVDFHGFDVTSFPRSHGWAAYRRCLRRAVAVVHSRFVEDLVKAHVGLECRLVTLGVDGALFGPVTREAAWPTPLKLVTVSRLTHGKGIHVALDALAWLRERRPELAASLDVVGDGPERPALERRSAALGLSADVTFRGALPPQEVSATMATADVLLVPSLIAPDGWQEAFCRVAVEGMGRGLLVIGTSSGGLGETIGAGGLTVAPGDAPALARAVLAGLAAGPPTWWARRARDRAEAFTLSAMWEAYDDVARRAIA